jgi:pyruvate/2-oxoglutarate dehydrogenase complex dihydrolipoamide acyltransferase (E2) component
MVYELNVPSEIPDDEEVIVVEVAIQNGEEVIEGQVVFVVETSKTTYEIIALTSGIVRHNQIEGAESKAGAILGRIEVA